MGLIAEHATDVADGLHQRILGDHHRSPDALHQLVLADDLPGVLAQNQQNLQRLGAQFGRAAGIVEQFASRQVEHETRPGERGCTAKGDFRVSQHGFDSGSHAGRYQGSERRTRIMALSQSCRCLQAS